MKRVTEETVHRDVESRNVKVLTRLSYGSQYYLWLNYQV